MTGVSPRRLVAIAAAGVALASGACGIDATSSGRSPSTSASVDTSPRPDPVTPSPTTTATSPEPSPSVTTSPPAPPPEATAWEPAAAEVHVEAKRAATDVALALTSYDADDAAEDVAGALVSGERRRALVTAAEELHHAGRWSRGRIVYPQMGGLNDRRASVMVVVEQTVGDGDRAPRVVTRTLDVRVERSGNDWVFDRLESAGGSEAPRPADLSAVAQAVLDDPRIELPDSARWDIHRGTVEEPLLRVMRDLADETSYGVVVLASGHPVDVFETGRPSSHTHGFAVDIHRLGDELVAEGRDVADSLTHRTSRWLYDLPAVSNLGSPWAFDGYGGRSFTDPVHLDHLHVSAVPASSP